MTLGGDYTMEMRLCDDDQMVSDKLVERGGNRPPIQTGLTYLELFNNLRARTRPYGEHKPWTEPFFCTGSAHLAGEHIRCTSPAHTRRSVNTGCGILTSSAFIDWGPC